MRILYVCQTPLDKPTGASEHVLACCRELCKSHDLTLLAPPYTRELPEAYDVVEMPSLRVKGLGAAGFNFSLARWLGRSGRQFDVLYVRSYPGLMAPALVAPRIGLPYLVELNGIREEEMEVAGAPRVQVSLALQAERMLVRKASAVIVPTVGIARHLHEAYRVPKIKISVVPNGVDTTKFQVLPKDEARNHLKLPVSGLYVGFLGGLFPWQGVEDLIRAGSSIDATILIGGDGPERTHLQQLAPPNVRFMGPISSSDAPRFLAACDVLVLTKKPLRSGFSPIKLFAYMAAGRPIVASDVPGLEVVKDVGGRLVAPARPEELAAAVREALASGDVGVPPNLSDLIQEHSWSKAAEKIVLVMKRSLTG